MKFSGKLFVLAAILPAMLWSCKENYEEQDWTSPKEGHINFSCTASAFGETLIWPDGTNIGLFCKQAEAVNVPVQISASSSGSEAGEFYSDVIWGEGSHSVYLYYPYQENAASEELSVELPSVWSQQGESYSHLLSRNLFHACIKTEPTEGQTVLQAVLEPVFKLAEVTVSTVRYEGYNLDRVSVKAKDGSSLAGTYKFNLETGSLNLTGGAGEPVPLTLNVSGVQLGDQPVSLWYLTGGADDRSVNCDIVVTLSSDKGSIELSGECDLTMETALFIDSFTSSAIEDDSIDLSDPDGDGVRETANCYVAGKAGQTYRFPATIMGNGYTTPAEPDYNFNGGTAPGITPSVMAPASAKVLWQTAPALITNVKLQNGHVYFDLPGDNGTFVPGNAVIAVYDGSGRILWSWHIWVTDADLEANLQTWKVHEDLAAYDAYQNPQLMDRNLGALSNLDWASSNTNASKGLFYQWGRKDPFIGPDNSSFNTRVATETYDSEGNKCGEYSTATSFSNAPKWTHIDQKLTRENIASYPMTFVDGEENYFWLDELAYDLWGLLAQDDEANTLGHKTIYDPCPPGYRVMNPYAFTGVMSTMAGGAYKTLGNGMVQNPSGYRNNGSDLKVLYDGTNVASLPACGLIYFEKGSNFFPFDRVGGYGYMWTSRMFRTGSQYQAERMHFDWNNFVSQEQAYASYGHGVRCEKIK